MRLYSNFLFFTIDIDLINCTEIFMALISQNKSNDNEYKINIYGHGAYAPTIKFVLLILHFLTLFFLLFENGLFLFFSSCLMFICNL